MEDACNESKYLNVWCDFVWIRYNLLFGDLNDLFLNKLKCKQKNIDAFYSYAKFQRNKPILFPTHGGYMYNFEHYKEMTNKFANTPFVTYLIIYNCIFNIYYNKLYDVKTKESYYGFEGLFSDLGEDFGCSNDFIGALIDYTLNKFCQTNVFGKYTRTKTGEYDLQTSEDEKKCILEENERALVNCKAVLFNNDLSQFSQFVRKSIKDIKNVKSYKINENEHWIDPNSGGRDYGFCNLIVNRMSFIVFHDLLVFCNNNNNNNIACM